MRFDEIVQTAQQPAEVIKQPGIGDYRQHPSRSTVRYRLFLFRNRGEEISPGLVRHFERQFREGWTWDNFSFVWDVSPSDPLRAVTLNEWLEHGGRLREERETALDGTVQKVARCYPNGFTRQGR
jgi:hypothetical protein